MKKNVFAALLALCMLSALLPTAALAAGTESLYTISVTPEAYDFGRKSKNYCPRSAYTYTVKNEGSLDVTLEALSGSAAFEIFTPNNWTSPLAPNDTRTFTVRPNDNLDTNTYDETFTVSTAQGTSDAFQAKFVVGTQMNVNITGNPANFVIVNGQTIELTANVTGGTADAESDYTYAWKKNPLPSEPPSDPMATSNPVTVNPTESTTYQVQVTEKDNSHSTATVLVKVVEPTHGSTVSPASLSFGTAREGYTQPNPQTVTVTYTGNIGSVTLTPPTSTSTDYDISSLSRTTLDTTHTTATFTVQPKARLGAGTYNSTVTVTVTGSYGVSGTVDIAFTVQPPYTVAASPNNAAYGSVTGGGLYMDNAPVTLTATANPGHHFVKWTENNTDVGAANPLTFNAAADRTLTAVFAADANPPASENIITNITSGQSYHLGDIVTFTAVGGGMSNTAPHLNEMRWLPIAWQTNPSGDFTSGYTQSFSTAGMSTGPHTLTITFQKQRYNGAAWENLTPAVTDQKSVPYTLAAANSQSAELPPKTGDSAAPPLWLCLLFVTGVLTLALAGKRRAHDEK